MKRYAIGVDVGATNFRLALVDSRGGLFHFRKFEVGAPRTAKGVVEQVGRAVEELKRASKGRIIGLGVGVPGIVDYERGCVLRSPHYPDWVHENLRDMFFKRTGLSTHLDNDANLIALGEMWKGAARGLRNFIMITLGTGIGCGIVLESRLWRGERGFAGEAGHMVINFDGPFCPCGGKGCWERYASQKGLKHLIEISQNDAKAEFLRENGGDAELITPEMLSNAAGRGSPFALAVWKMFGAYLGAGIASLVNILGVENVIVGGGLSKAWEFFADAALIEIKRRTYAETAERIILRRAELSDSAGILGGAKEVFSSRDRHQE